MIVLLNGAFGIGKTTVARLLVRRLRRAILFDPEIFGLVLQRVARLGGKRVEDFQDLVLWRRLTIVGVWATRLFWPNVVVPMAFSNIEYLDEIRAGLQRFEPRLLHLCLVAPVDVVHQRLRARGADVTREAWEYRRAAECCIAHAGEEFATRVPAAGRDPEQIAEELFSVVAAGDTTSSHC
ncbi:MAG TPA: AAA family ATPase [Thermoanaerobaculia bacterium]